MSDYNRRQQELVTEDMSDNREQLSAFLDDNLGADERLHSDDAADETLVRYSLIGDAMRGELNEATLLNVSRTVSEQIATDGSPAAAVETPATPVRETEKAASWFGFGAWWQPVGGLAIAASVAMMVVLGLDQQTGVTPGASSQLAEQAAPVEATVEPPAARAVANSEQPRQPNLEQYLDEHSIYAGSDTLQGRLPYVRAVGYKSE